MNIEQKYELLCQIARDYGLAGHMDRNREQFAKELNLLPVQVGNDVAIVDALVNDEGLFPVNYVLAVRRASERLG